MTLLTLCVVCVASAVMLGDLGVQLSLSKPPLGSRCGRNPEPGHGAGCTEPGSCMFFIIQEDMSGAAGGGVCPCRADGGRPRGRRASEQVDRLEGRRGRNLDSLRKCRWRKQNKTHLLQLKVFIIFSDLLHFLLFLRFTFRRSNCGPVWRKNCDPNFCFSLWIFRNVRPFLTFRFKSGG